MVKIENIHLYVSVKMDIMKIKPVKYVYNAIINAGNVQIKLRIVYNVHQIEKEYQNVINAYLENKKIKKPCYV